MRLTMLKWQDLLRHSVRGNSIKASVLRKIPHLKACPYWDRAQFLGKISYRLQFANYNGGLVLYDNRIYYINLSQIEALRQFVRWDLRKTVTVTEE
jgi:hypothetical protein